MDKSIITYGIGTLLLIISYISQIFLKIKLIFTIILFTIGIIIIIAVICYYIRERLTQNKRILTSFVGFLLITCILIMNVSFMLYLIKFLEKIILYQIVGVGSIITLVFILILKLIHKKTKHISKEIKKIKKVEIKKEPKKKNRSILKICYLIGILLVVLGFILFQKNKSNILIPGILVIIGFLITSIPSIYIENKLGKINKIKDESEKREKKVEDYNIKPLKKTSETQLDELFDMINETGIVKLSEVAKKFNIKKETAEEWGKILEEHNLIELHYPAFGELEFRKWKK